MTANILTQARLRFLLEYNPHTGEFFRKDKYAPGNKDSCGTVDSGGYLLMTIDGVSHRLHRLAFLYMDGLFPHGEVDHINGARSDNRWINLRKTSHIENSRNQKRKLNNKTGITGVHWSKEYKKWIAQVCINGKSRHLISTSDLFEAICARKSAELRHGFHNNHGRRF